RVPQKLAHCPELIGLAALSRDSITQFANAFLLRAMRTAEHDASFSLYAVPNNPATAMIAGRRQRVYCAFETVERMSAPARRDLPGRGERIPDCRRPRERS